MEFSETTVALQTDNPNVLYNILWMPTVKSEEQWMKWNGKFQTFLLLFLFNSKGKVLHPCLPCRRNVVIFRRPY